MGRSALHCRSHAQIFRCLTSLLDVVSLFGATNNEWPLCIQDVIMTCLFVSLEVCLCLSVSLPLCLLVCWTLTPFTAGSLPLPPPPLPRRSSQRSALQRRSMVPSRSRLAATDRHAAAARRTRQARHSCHFFHAYIPTVHVSSRISERTDRRRAM